MEESPYDGEEIEDSPYDEGQWKPKTERRGRNLLTGIITAAVAVAALLVFAFRDGLTPEGLQRLFGIAAPGEERPPFSYESGSDLVFATCGNGLAVASGSVIELFGASGESVFREIVYYDCPAVFASATGALFCDLGGDGCAMVSYRGEKRPLEPRGEILTAHRTEDGWVALTTTAAGYKGLVSVYDASAVLRYEWWSGAGYVLKACVSPDHSYLAALCAVDGGSVLHVYRLDSEEEYASFSFAGELPFELGFLSEENLCVAGKNALSFLTAAGETLDRYELGSYTLADYDLGGQGFAAVFVRSGAAGQGGLLQTFDADGTPLAYAELDRDPVSLLTGGYLALYDREMHEKYWDDGLMTATKAMLRSNGSAFLVGSYAAEILEF